MSQSGVRVVARFKVKPGREDEFVALAREALVEPTQREPGCIAYDLFRDEADPSCFAMIEAWESADALAAHLAQPSLQEAVSKLVPLGDGAIEVRRYRSLDGDA